jgi:hypothetical protein
MWKMTTHRTRTTLTTTSTCEFYCLTDIVSDSDLETRFVDQDMLMRFLGGGVGHKATRGIVCTQDSIQQIKGAGALNQDDNFGSDTEDVVDVLAGVQVNNGEDNNWDRGDGSDDRNNDEAQLEEEIDYGYDMVSESDDEGENDDEEAVDSNPQHGKEATEEMQDTIHGSSAEVDDDDSEPWLGPEDGEDRILDNNFGYADF